MEQTSKNSDEITLKQLILIIKDYFFEVLRKWWIVLFFLAAFISFQIYKHVSHTTMYQFDLKFMVESESKQPSFGGLLGQLGIAQNSTNPSKIIEVAKSNNTFRKIAFSKMNDNYIANQIIEQYKLDEKWAENNDKFSQFRFKNDSLKSELERIAFKKLATITWKGVSSVQEPLLTINYNFDSGIYLVSSNTKYDKLSSYLVNVVYEKIEYFFETDIQKNKARTLSILNAKSDSLKILLDVKNRELAKFDDRSIGVVNNLYKSQRNIIQQEFLALSSSFLEISKNIELAEFNLNNSQALFLVVNKTVEPIFGIRSQLANKLIIGIGLGLFFSVFIIVLMKLYKSIMESE